jgi:hypothetical protein
MPAIPFLRIGEITRRKTPTPTPTKPIVPKMEP